MHVASVLSIVSIVLSANAVAAGGTPPPSLSPIKNFVVLCMENHSFDAILGWWAKTQPGMDGIPSGAAACNTNHKTGQVFCADNQAQYIQQFDPDHQVDATTQQIYGMQANDSIRPNGTADMSGFVDSAVMEEEHPVYNEPSGLNDDIAAQTVMSSFDPSKLPVTFALAEEYAVFDRWFAGVPGPTFPNRVFLMSGTSHGLFENNAKQLLSGFPQKSVFQMFEDAGLSYKNYYDQVPTGLVFNDFRERLAKDILELHPHKHVGTLNQFEADAASGQLPNFSWIDPVLISLPGQPANDNHPPHDIARGEALVKRIYDALRSSPQWESTAFLITYDEHGGFWDHVPPVSNVPIPDDASAQNTMFHFDRVGVRVPSILISPYVAKNSLIHKPSTPAPSSFSFFSDSEFDHSSVVKTVNDIFGLQAPLTNRTQWAGSFADVFLSSPRTDCLVDLPSPPAIDLTAEIADIENEWSEIVGVFSHRL